MSAIDRVAQRYLDAAALIKLREDGGLLIVSGPYDAMKDVYPKLKRLGFTYNGMDKSWRLPVAKATPQIRQKVEALLKAANPDPVDVAKKEADVRALFQEALTAKLTAFKFTQAPNPNTIILTGMTFPMKDEAKAAGGSWGEGVVQGYLFTVGAIEPAAFKKFLGQLDHQSDQYKAQQVKTLAVVGDGKTWPTIGVTMTYVSGRGVVLRGNTRPFREDIRSLFARPSWTTEWLISSLEKATSFERLMMLFDDAEVKAKAEADAVAKATPANVPAPAATCRPNRKPGYCSVCGHPVQIGEGCIYQVYDPNIESDYDDDMRWVVRHKDTALCSRLKRERQEHQEQEHQKAMGKLEARRKLRELAMKDGDYLPGEHRLPDEQIYIEGRNSVIYGGGIWVVIEPDKRHFWYVINNGADGDDWSSNNVLTGGAGAIGRKVPLTDEALAIIEAAKE
ncbi:MAG: hypothetical protein A2Y38_02765 [Spirochaetes bacterium GWB1_59_5]|nr:MAG: hypothetical protein A2Y38_02765 [Spirochaetes bacterium GWB1_59_5]